MRVLLLIFALLLLSNATIAKPVCFDTRVEMSDEDAYAQCIGKAEAGNIYAQRTLGIGYEFGYRTKASNAEALKWYLMAAKNGNLLAQTAVGDLYIEGKGVIQNLDEGLKWLNRAAEQGNLYSQMRLGRFYFREDGNMIEAFKWYDILSRRGHPGSSIFRKATSAFMTPRGVQTAQELTRQWLEDFPQAPY